MLSSGYFVVVSMENWFVVNVAVVLELLFWSIGFGRCAMFEVVELRMW
jgi:hypothetical protein